MKGLVRSGMVAGLAVVAGMLAPVSAQSAFAKGNKTKICHATGSGSFVQIKVKDHGLPAHAVFERPSLPSNC